MPRDPGPEDRPPPIRIGLNHQIPSSPNQSICFVVLVTMPNIYVYTNKYWPSLTLNIHHRFNTPSILLGAGAYNYILMFK